MHISCQAIDFFEYCTKFIKKNEIFCVKLRNAYFLLYTLSIDIKAIKIKGI